MSITARVNYLGGAGLVQSVSQGAWDFIYETSLVRNSKWNVGDRIVLPDGRVYRYAKAGNIIANIRQGVKCYNLKSDGVSYTAATASAIGDKEITVDAGNEGDWTKDELAGAYIIIHTHGDLKHQFLGVIGNTASDANGNITIFLDGPLTHTITPSHGVEVHLNPYSDVRQQNSTTGKPGDHYSSVLGMPVVHTVAANQYLWLQTWGPCWANPHGTMGYASTAGERQVVFDWEGSISFEGDAVGTGASMQDAGFQIERQTSGTGSGFFMLQISC